MHVAQSLQDAHSTGLDSLLGEAVTAALAAISGHPLPPTVKKARKYGPESLAPTGFELSASGPGRSLANTKGPTLYGFRRIAVPSAPAVVWFPAHRGPERSRPILGGFDRSVTFL
jgi:hypothetical protein